MSERRRHSKVVRLPVAIRDAVNTLIVSGKTIDEVLTHLRLLADQGEIPTEALPSRSGVGRYAKGFIARLEKMDLVREQAKTIVERAEGQGLVVEEAAVSLVLNEIMTILMPEDGKLSPKTVASVALALSKLQSSSATRERAKIEIRKDLARRAVVAAKEVGKMAKSQGLSANAVDEIKKKILGISDVTGK